MVRKSLTKESWIHPRETSKLPKLKIWGALQLISPYFLRIFYSFMPLNPCQTRGIALNKDYRLKRRHFVTF